MRLKFIYDRTKDIWCLLNKGPSSNNSNKPTKVYTELTESYGGNPTEEGAEKFIEEYLEKNSISIEEKLEEYKNDWEKVENQFQKKAEELFQVSLPEDIKVYLTVNNRCPYNIKENYFFVSLSSEKVRETIMHELWHFYTWYRFGDWQEKIGREKYNDIKEALTVLINVECKDLLPTGSEGKGYPQHEDMREGVINFWNKENNIDKLWLYLVN